MKEITIKIKDNMYNDFINIAKYVEARYDTSEMDNVEVDDEYMQELIIALIERYIDSAPTSFWEEVKK